MKTITRINGRLPIVAAALTAISMLSIGAYGAKAQTAPTSNIIIVNSDGPGEGLNDPTPTVPVGGNFGATLGAQRLAVFEAAASVWENILVSDVPIQIEARFDNLNCTANSATLGQAGPINAFTNFQGAPVADTFHVVALANSLAGVDLEPGVADIQMFFNARLGQANCLAGTPFFLSITGLPAPGGTISLFDTILHEMAHGLGFLTFTNLQTGERPADRNDAFSRNLEDQIRGLSWPQLTNAERAASATNNFLRWTGSAARACAANVLRVGAAQDGDVIMFAPSQLRGGSSVSHFDPALGPSELMEAFATPTSILDVTSAALADMGWRLSPQAQQELCQPAQVAQDQ